MYELLILVAVLAILGPLAYTIRGHRIWQIWFALTGVKVLWQRRRPAAAETESSPLFDGESGEPRFNPGSGLPMLGGSVDVGGNAYGSDDSHR